MVSGAAWLQPAVAECSMHDALRDEVRYPFRMNPNTKPDSHKARINIHSSDIEGHPLRMVFFLYFWELNEQETPDPSRTGLIPGRVQPAPLCHHSVNNPG